MLVNVDVQSASGWHRKNMQESAHMCMCQSRTVRCLLHRLVLLVWGPPPLFSHIIHPAGVLTVCCDPLRTFSCRTRSRRTRSSQESQQPRGGEWAASRHNPASVRTVNCADHCACGLPRRPTFILSSCGETEKRFDRLSLFSKENFS